LFVQTLRLCGQARLVGLGTLALDGTKLRANASRHKAMSYARMGKAEAQLEAEIAAIRANVLGLLEEAEAVDAEEDERFGADRRGDELPAELRRREQRLAAIREAKQALEAEAAEREDRRAEREAQGKKPRRPPNGRDPFKPRSGRAAQLHRPRLEDYEDLRRPYQQCYNGQAFLDSQAQVIVACEPSDEAPDARQLEPALDRLVENLDAKLERRRKVRFADPARGDWRRAATFLAAECGWALPPPRIVDRVAPHGDELEALLWTEPL
jgi:hypothetical protein